MLIHHSPPPPPTNAISLNWLSFLLASLAPHQQHSSGGDRGALRFRPTSPSLTRVGPLVHFNHTDRRHIEPRLRSQGRLLI